MPPKRPQLIVEALYAYRAADTNQINLNPGDRIIVLEKDPSGWWIGRAPTGEPGIFPATYVREINPEDHAASGVPSTSRRVRALIQPTGESDAGSTADKELGERLGLTQNDMAGSESDSEEDAQAPSAGAMNELFMLRVRVERLEKANAALESRVTTQKATIQSLESELARGSKQMANMSQLQAQYLEEIRRLQIRLVDAEGALGDDAPPPRDFPPVDQALSGLINSAATSQAMQRAAAAERMAAATASDLADANQTIAGLKVEINSLTARILVAAESASPGAAAVAAVSSTVSASTAAAAAASADPLKPMSTADDKEDKGKDGEDGEREPAEALRRLRGKYAKLEAAYREQRKKLKALEGADGADADAAKEKKEKRDKADKADKADKEKRALPEAGPPPALPALPSLSSEAYEAMKLRLEEEQRLSRERLGRLEEDMQKRDSELVEVSAKLRKYKKYAEKQLAKERGAERATTEIEARLKAIHEEELRTYEDRIRDKDEQLAALQQEMESIKRQGGAAADEAKRLKAEVAQLNSELNDVRARYQKEERLRRKIYNELQELKGNIRVFCRVRAPLTKEEKENVCVGPDPVTEGKVVTMETDGRPRHAWEFDQVFAPAAKQEEVFEGVKPLALSVLDGYNICVFAYGQTGSGKTYTMVGPPTARGVNHRTVAEVFDQISKRTGDYTTSVAIACTEIYNEEVYDLLSGREILDVRLQTEGKRVKVVTGAKEATVTNADEVISLMEAAFAARATASHDVNAHSSRSHCILTLFCKTTDKTTGAATVGKIHLVDLAGSERQRKTGASGDRLKEASAINKSLFELGNTIRLLARKEKASFRNSKLTLMLADSLGGNCKCLMFANVSPHREHIEETEITLRFAAGAKEVRRCVSRQWFAHRTGWVVCFRWRFSCCRGGWPFEGQSTLRHLLDHNTLFSSSALSSTALWFIAMSVILPPAPHTLPHPRLSSARRL